MEWANQQSRHALLVIDVQDSFMYTDDWTEADLQQYQSHQLSLIEQARIHHVPVIGILHENPPNTGRPSFRKESGHVRLMNWLPQLDEVFKKSVHNALTDSGLLAYLQHHQITHLTISGIRTEQCCETTARVASDVGFQVYYVTDATLTFPMTHRDGTEFSVSEIKRHTELVLQDRFAQIKTVTQMGEAWS